MLQLHGWCTASWSAEDLSPIKKRFFFVAHVGSVYIPLSAKGENFQNFFVWQTKPRFRVFVWFHGYSNYSQKRREILKIWQRIQKNWGKQMALQAGKQNMRPKKILREMAAAPSVIFSIRLVSFICPKKWGNYQRIRCVKFVAFCALTLQWKSQRKSLPGSSFPKKTRTVK